MSHRCFSLIGLNKELGCLQPCTGPKERSELLSPLEEIIFRRVLLSPPPLLAEYNLTAGPPNPRPPAWLLPRRPVTYRHSFLGELKTGQGKARSPHPPCLREDLTLETRPYVLLGFPVSCKSHQSFPWRWQQQLAQVPAPWLQCTIQLFRITPYCLEVRWALREPRGWSPKFSILEVFRSR